MKFQITGDLMEDYQVCFEIFHPILIYPFDKKSGAIIDTIKYNQMTK